MPWLRAELKKLRGYEHRGIVVGRRAELAICGYAPGRRRSPRRLKFRGYEHRAAWCVAGPTPRLRV
jgi:hypothetical protein